MKTKILVLAAAIALIGTPVFSAGLHGMPEGTTKKVASTSYCGVTTKTIWEYMLGYGINLVYFEPVPGTCNCHCEDNLGRWYIVYISNGVITGWDQSNG